jgi:hypothetical protein
MSLEKTIIDLTSQTPSGGTCWIGDIPFTVWYCSDYWEWVFRGVYYFDPLDLGEAIDAFVQQTAEGPPQAVSLSEMPKARPGLVRRKFRMVAADGGTSAPIPGQHPRHPHALRTRHFGSGRISMQVGYTRPSG